MDLPDLELRRFNTVVHRRILGVPPDRAIETWKDVLEAEEAEADSAVLLRAVVEKFAHVRQYEVSQYQEQAQELLDALGAIYVWLRESQLNGKESGTASRSPLLDLDAMAMELLGKTALEPSEATTIPEDGWYYQVLGSTVGPVTLAVLRKLAGIGRLTWETPIRAGHQGSWVSAWRVPGLFAATEPGANGTAAPVPAPPLAASGTSPTGKSPSSPDLRGQMKSALAAELLARAEQEFPAGQEESGLQPTPSIKQTAGTPAERDISRRSWADQIAVVRSALALLVGLVAWEVILTALWVFACLAADQAAYYTRYPYNDDELANRWSVLVHVLGFVLVACYVVCSRGVVEPATVGVWPNGEWFSRLRDALTTWAAILACGIAICFGPGWLLGWAISTALTSLPLAWIFGLGAWLAGFPLLVVSYLRNDVDVEDLEAGFRQTIVRFSALRQMWIVFYLLSATLVSIGLVGWYFLRTAPVLSKVLGGMLLNGAVLAYCYLLGRMAREVMVHDHAG